METKTDKIIIWSIVIAATVAFGYSAIRARLNTPAGEPCNPHKRYQNLFVINDSSTLPKIISIMSEQQLLLDKEVYTFYYTKLLEKQQTGEKCHNGKSIQDLLHIVKNHIDNIDLTLQKIHHENEVS